MGGDAGPLVVCAGIAVLDVVMRVDAFPTSGKQRASERAIVGGGVAANAAATVARLGGRARMLSCLGDDATGDQIASGLAEAGVAADRIHRLAGRESPLSAVLVDRTGERLIVNHASPDLFASAATVTAADLTGAGAVLVDMRWHRGALAALREAGRIGVPGILDCDHDPTGAEVLLAAATHVIFSLGTLAAYVGTDDPGAALTAIGDITDAWGAATDGERGVFWLEGGVIRHLPAFPVEAVDTLGAGDIFHGAFALALAEGRATEPALRFAAAAAALKCTRFGGRAAIPRRDEVEQLLAGRS